MGKRRILLIVPYKARDLEAQALIGYHLEQQYGYEVLCSNGYRIERKLYEYQPDALVLDHLCWNFKVAQARLAKKLGMKLIVLPTEGFVQDKEGALEVVGHAHGVTGLIDANLSWGTFQREAVLEKALIPESQIQTVGGPRFDFYCEPYLSLAEAKEDFSRRLGISNPEAPLILWATNTPYLARNPKKIIHRYITRAGWTVQQVRTFLDDQVTQFHAHSQLVLELARRHPEWNFLIKVHPAEWINPYVPLTKESRNIHLGFNAPIRDFLYHCDVLLQRNCTTATEAWMLKKPVLQLEIGSYSADSRQEYKAGNDVVTSFDEAHEMIINYLTGRPISEDQRQARESFISEFYFRIDGRASERCAEMIHKVVSPPSYTDYHQAQTRSATQIAYAQWQQAENARLANRVKDGLGIKRDVSLRFWKKLTRNEAKDNLGLFTAEVEITPDQISNLYRRYESVTSISKRHSNIAM